MLLEESHSPEVELVPLEDPVRSKICFPCTQWLCLDWPLCSEKEFEGISYYGSKLLSIIEFRTPGFAKVILLRNGRNGLSVLPNRDLVNHVDLG